MVRAGARPAGEIASCGAGAAGLKPRVDGVRVELRERAGAASARPGGARRALICGRLSFWQGKPGGRMRLARARPDAPRRPARGRRPLR